MSTKGDDLSQWRGYCPDNAGYNIEFDINHKFFQNQKDFNTTKEINPDNKSVILLKQCKYKEDEKRELLQSLLSWFRESDEKDADIELFFSILSLSVFFKDESFIHEDEYRLLVMLDKSDNELMEFRQGKSTLIPYLELSTELSNITGITIGPTPSGQHSKSAVKMLINKINRNNKEEVIRLNIDMPTLSKVTYRSW